MEEGRPIIYKDETFTYSRHTRPKNWMDDIPSGYTARVSKSRRLIILHAGDRTGFIPGELLMFKSHLKTGNERDKFSDVANRKLISNLPP
jgi:hypothetical protein